MGLSRMHKKCMKCPFVARCEKKREEHLGYLEPAAAPVTAELGQLILVPHDYRDIKVGENTTVTIDVEDFKRQLEQSIYRSAGLGLQFGA